MHLKNDRPAILMFQDGRYFEGIGFGATKKVCGEIVFTTSMVGYNETITDPSFHEQICIMTYPLIGNYGVPDWIKDEYGIHKCFESDSIKIKGLVVNEYCKIPSHYESVKSLDDFLQEQDVPGIEWVDTRALTKIIRDEGVKLGLLQVFNPGEKPDIALIKEEVKEISDPNNKDLVSEVSTEKVRHFIPSNPVGTVIVLDLGTKLNIIRNLLKRNLNVILVPHDFSYDQIMDYNPNGVLISNGPGDPLKSKSAIEVAENLIENSIPAMGICLGDQIIGLGAGAKTYKLKFGHRGGNKSVIHNPTGRCFITTQNHGYGINTDNLEEVSFKEFFYNPDDKTNEGIIHKTKPIFSLQFHPESSPGPKDTQAFLFDVFLKFMGVLK